MITSILRRLAIEALRASGRPELNRVADFIEDTPKAAVVAVVRYFSGKTNKTHLTDKDAEDILNIQEKYSKSDVSPGQPESRLTFLDEYLELLRMIAESGRSGNFLLLQGFIHSEDCASLWRFDHTIDFKTIVGAGGEPAITFQGVGSPYLRN